VAFTPITSIFSRTEFDIEGNNVLQPTDGQVFDIGEIMNTCNFQYRSPLLDCSAVYAITSGTRNVHDQFEGGKEPTAQLTDYRKPTKFLRTSIANTTPPFPGPERAAATAVECLNDADCCINGECGACNLFGLATIPKQEGWGRKVRRRLDSDEECTEGPAEAWNESMVVKALDWLLLRLCVGVRAVEVR